MYKKQGSELAHRTEAFANAVFEYSKCLTCDARGKTAEDQMARSSASVAANYLEACNARTSKEFVSKVSIALQEAEECRFFLRLSVNQKLGPADRGKALESEGHEIVKMLVASLKTAKNSQTTRRSGS